MQWGVDRVWTEGRFTIARKCSNKVNYFTIDMSVGWSLYVTL